jgi:hypothetical protein
VNTIAKIIVIIVPYMAAFLLPWIKPWCAQVINAKSPTIINILSLKAKLNKLLNIIVLVLYFNYLVQFLNLFAPYLPYRRKVRTACAPTVSRIQT